MNKAIVLSLITLLVVCGSGRAMGRTFKLALPGYVYAFPQDHYSHDDYKTEWWYYTGHLHAKDGTRYGYELTFFRVGMDVSDPPPRSFWSVPNVYMAHFAVSDISGKRFFHSQKLNRPGIGNAGASQTSLDIFNQNWSLTGTPEEQILQARDWQRSPDGNLGTEYAINLKLHPAKPPVEEGVNGVSQKADCRGCASHYYSYTRLLTGGEMTIGGRTLIVDGTSWMDHEFGSNQLAPDQAGWDWFAIQLKNNSELMLYVMRKKDGTIDPHSAGTVVFPDGKSAHLKQTEFTIKSTRRWRSEASGAIYPMEWNVRVPAYALELHISPDLDNQELLKRHPRDVTYWEGSSSVTGTADGKPVQGEAYVEMTGYAAAFSGAI